MRRPGWSIFPRWYFPVLAALLVAWTAMEVVNLRRNRQVGKVFWLNSSFGYLRTSDNGGWTSRRLRLPLGDSHTVIGESLWWTLGDLLDGSPRRRYGLEVARLQPRGQVQRLDLADAVDGWEWPRVRELTSAPHGVWVATGRGPGRGHPRETALFDVDIADRTYRLVPGMYEAETSPDGRITAMLGLDGAVRVTGAGVATVTCPPYRVAGLQADFATNRLLLRTRLDHPGSANITDGPTILVDLHTGEQATMPRRSWRYVDYGEGEWWVSHELFPHGPCYTNVWDPYLRHRRRHLWTGNYAWAINQVGYVDPAMARLIESLANLTDTTIANAPRISLREAKPSPAAKTR